jgi:hypothetical protein
MTEEPEAPKREAPEPEREAGSSKDPPPQEAKKRRSRQKPEAYLQRKLELRDRIEAVTERIEEDESKWDEYVSKYINTLSPKEGEVPLEVVEYAEEAILIGKIQKGEGVRKVYKAYRDAVSDKERAKRVLKRVSRVMGGRRREAKSSEESTAESRSRSRQPEVPPETSTAVVPRSRSRAKAAPETSTAVVPRARSRAKASPRPRAARAPVLAIEDKRGRSESRGQGQLGGSASNTRASRSRSRLAIVPV